MSTGRELDVAPAGETWMAVLAPDGSETYTRRGDLHIADSGLMVNGTGDVVLGINGPITIPPSAGLEVGVDGAVTVQPLGQNSNTRLLIDRIKLVTPEQGELVKDINGKFRTADNVPLDPNASAKLLTGVLEGSNVNVVEGMVSMIENSRNYELQIKMMKNAEDKERTGGRLLRNPS